MTSRHTKSQRLALALAAAGLFAGTALFAAPAAAQYSAYRPDPGAELTRHLGTLADQPRSLHALMGAGKAALALGDAQAALTFFARAEEVAPRDGRVKAGMGSALLQMEQPAAALRFFSDAASLGAPIGEYASDRGLAWDLAGNQTQAQADYRAALARGDDGETRRRLALSLAISGNKDEALKLADEQIRRNDRAGWRVRAFVLALSGDTEGASKAMKAVMPALAPSMQPFFASLPALAPAQRALAVHYGHFPNGQAYRLAQTAQAMQAAKAAEETRLAAAVEQPAAKETKKSRRDRSRARREAPTRLAEAVRRRPGMKPTDPVALAAPAARREATRDRRSNRSAVQVASNQAPAPAVARAPVTRTPAPAAPAPAPVWSAPAPAGPAPGFAMTSTTVPTAQAPTPAPRNLVPVVTTPAPVAPAALPPSSAAPQPLGGLVQQTAAAAPQPSPPAAAPLQPARTQPTPQAPGAQTAPASVSAAPSPFGPPSAPPAEPVQIAGSTPLSSLGSSTQPPAAAQPEPAPFGPPTPPAAEAKAEPAPFGPPTPAPAAEAKPEPTPFGPPTPAPAPRFAAIADTVSTLDTPAAAKAAEPAQSEPKPEPKAEEKAKKPAASAKKAEAAKPAAKKTAEAKKPKAASRIWVQIAGGADKRALPREFTRLKTKAPKLLASRAAWTTPLKATNRLLVGPFKSDAEAQDFVNEMAKLKLTAFSWTSPAGQEIEKLPAR